MQGFSQHGSWHLQRHPCPASDVHAGGVHAPGGRDPPRMEKAAAGNASRAQPTIATCAIGPEIRTDSRPQTSPPSYKPDRIARCLPPIASTSAKLAPGRSRTQARKMRADPKTTVNNSSIRDSCGGAAPALSASAGRLRAARTWRRGGATRKAGSPPSCRPATERRGIRCAGRPARGDGGVAEGHCAADGLQAQMPKPLVDAALRKVAGR